VIVLSFANEFPDGSATLAQQMFSVVVAGLGLAGFALVLALVEQVVLVSEWPFFSVAELRIKSAWLERVVASSQHKLVAAPDARFPAQRAVDFDG
jgi:hypothetical protein